MKVTEIFRSIEGETSTAGFPAVFVRFTGCNLSCPYCDSKHALTGGNEMTVPDIMLAVQRLGKVHHITLTGGEPLMQKDITRLTEFLCAGGNNLQIETNGTLPINGLHKAARIILDVKTPSSGGSFLKDNLKYLKPGDELKFVIGSVDDYSFAREFIEDNKPEVTVNFSSNGELSHKELAELILNDSLDVRLNVQIHKLIGIQ
ncbi:MAG: 7-carboxy-7-deazaguanine synthase QueE [Spirochaetia bacterium]|jgi:7-carboxy-7-deazaguanine synthase|nr:7-carboxy-7-deazaguanine synthase QueE [Spirochaetia bacterium]